MASFHSMWLRRPSIMMVSVFMIAFLCSTEAMPREDCSQGGGTDTGGGGLFSWVNEKTQDDRARCVPFHQCCDNTDPDNEEDQPSYGVPDVRSGNAIIDIGAGSDSKCGGGLNMCCRCVKDDTSAPEPIKPTITDKVSAPLRCGKRNVDGVRIIVLGFEEGQTQQGEFPWMVVVMEKDTTYVGGGSLVNPKVVLTAGHKVHKRTPDSLIVRIGDWDISKQIESIAPQIIDVEKILYHPNFNRSLHHYNIAILILKAEAVYGDTVAPVCLPEPGQHFDGQNCFVTGWGKDKFGDEGKYQTIMKKEEVPILDHSRCQTMLRATRLGSDFVLHSSFTCAGGLKEDACIGDGGSPLVCPGPNPDELVQVGVVSWGIECGVVGNPGVYGSVIESMDWITETIHAEIGAPVDLRLS